MNIRVLVMAAFVSLFILAGCAAPTPTPVPIATWVAQGIPGDLVIVSEDLVPWSWGHHVTIRITADGTATYTCVGEDCAQQRAGKLLPDALRRVVLAFGDKRFFYLTDADGCVVEITSPRSSSRCSPVDIPMQSVSIRINGTSKEITSWEGPCYSSYGKGGANSKYLIGILRGVSKDLPPMTPTSKAVPPATPVGRGAEGAVAQRAEPFQKHRCPRTTTG